MKDIYYLKCAECGKIEEYNTVIEEWYFDRNTPYCPECVEERNENE